MTDTAINPAEALPPAGWYRDPSGAPGQRYFDGTGWTEHHRIIGDHGMFGD